MSRTTQRGITLVLILNDRHYNRFIHIYFVCGGFQLSNPVGYRYLYTVSPISVVNGHATSAYKCELLTVTCELSVRLDNADQ